MADVSKIKIIDGTVCEVNDYRVPTLPNSKNVYLRGDGNWEIPTSSSSSGVIFLDGGDYLKVEIHS